jgi:uncharacterized protein (TIGR02391 family)
MTELTQLFPDVDNMLALEAEELGAVVLSTVRKQVKKDGRVHMAAFLGALFQEYPHQSGGFPSARRKEIELAIAESWNWLEVQGLLLPAPDGNGAHGWRVMSRRAERFASVEDVKKFTAGRRLPRESLHPTMRDKVWSAFIRGEFDVAAFQAMKAVEVAVRDACPGIPAHVIGKDLMRKAFNPETGPLTDKQALAAEQESRANLFAGAIGSYKNPLSHRDVDFEHPDEAIEIVLLANHLLRIVDSRSKANQLAARAPQPD